jgi:SAM-dependent methyltransferase
MTGFTASWLAQREAADAKARAATPLPDVSAMRESVLRVIDLGAGTGNNLRYLASRFGGRQHWTLVDDDAALLASVKPPRMWSPLTVEALRLDLEHLQRIPLERCDLITASALLDLASRGWIGELAQLCADRMVPAGLFALNYDGRIAWTPEEPEDSWVSELFHRHMRRDKGLGIATGPDSATAAKEAFIAAGYGVRGCNSAWRLGDAERQLQNALLDGYEQVGREMAAGKAQDVAGWAERRRAHLVAGRSTLLVGHEDLLVNRG